MGLISHIGKNIDFFEMDRVLEDITKNYAAPCATTWFKISKYKNPSLFEYRGKVIEFLEFFKNMIVSCYDRNENFSAFEIYINKLLSKEISLVYLGKNSEVEKRYKYYVTYKC